MPVANYRSPDNIITIVVDARDIEDLKENLGKIPQAINRLGRNISEKIREFAVERTPVLTGKLKGSWTPVQEEGESFWFNVGYPYGRILEEGLYPFEGRGTIRVGDRIFSKKAIGGILAPILDETEESGKTVSAAVAESIVKFNEEIDGL
jgi:hypothetical protein